MNLSLEADVLLLGSGFSASLLAIALRRQGRRVIMVESQRHPRFAIGESSTPLANLLLEQFATEYEIPEIAGFAKWGSWRRQHPEVSCGLKRGFTFYHHTLGKRFEPDPDRERQLLVAASPSDEVADTHWYRPEFDETLARLAVSRGATLLESTRVERVESAGDSLTVFCRSEDRPIEIHPRWVVDATGPRGCLARFLELPEERYPDLPHTETLFAHFAGVRTLDEVAEYQSSSLPPYPPDAAAVHHVFRGGWIWILRFNNGITSAGVALTRELAREMGLKADGVSWDAVLDRLPSVKKLFASARPVTPWIHQPQMSYLCGRSIGPGWVLMPSAIGFVDPLLSSGFPLTLWGVHRLATVFGQHWEQPSLVPAMEAQVQKAREELLRCAALLAGLYRTMDDFPSFVALTKLYFAAASFAETERRLGRVIGGEGTFLLGHHPRFQAGFRECLELAGRSDSESLIRRVHQCIEPFDIAGLTRTDRSAWYPVDLDDLVRGASKLPASLQELDQMLRTAGLGGLPAAGAAR